MKHRYILILILILAGIVRITYWLYTSPPITTEVSYWGLIFSLLFILSTYLVGKRLFGGAGGIVSALLVGFAPSVLIKFSMFPNGVYNIILFLGNLLFLLSIDIWEDSKVANKLYFILIAVISLWLHIYSIYFIIPCIFFIMFNKKRRIDILMWFIPLILLIILMLFKSKIALNDLEEIIVYKARDVMAMQLYDMLDIKSLYSVPGVIGIIYFAGFVYLCYRLRNRLFGSRESLILIFIIFSVLLISRVRAEPALDFSPSIFLYAGFSYVVVHMMKRHRLLLLCLALFIVTLQIQDCILSAINEREENIVKKQELDRLINSLQREDMHFLYTIPEIMPFINFLAGGDIIAESYDRYSVVPSQPAVALPVSGGIRFERDLRYICKDFKKVPLGRYMLFYSFTQPSAERREIPPLVWDASANYNNEDAKLAFDRDVTTRWTTHVRKIPNMYFQLDLGVEIIFDKIIFYLDRHELDRPIALNIEVSSDKENWEKVVYIEDDNILFWSGPYLYWQNHADRQEYYFEPVRARYIRINQLGFQEEDHNYWAITEVFIYTPIGDCRKLNYDMSVLNPYIREKGLYADYWLKGPIEKIGEKIDMSSNPIIIVDSNTNIDDNLKRYDIDYKRDVAGDFLIYHLYNPGFSVLDKKNLTGSSNIQTRGVEKAFDNDLETRWTTDRVQEQGYYYEIDLREERTVSGVRLWHKGSPNDWPRDIRIEVLDSDSKWKAMGCKRDFSDSLYWTGFSIITDNSECYTYVFSPVKIRAIRCILTEGDNRYYWSIHEIDMLTTETRKQEENKIISVN